MLRRVADTAIAAVVVLGWWLLLSSPANPLFLVFGAEHWQTVIAVIGVAMLAGLFVVGLRRGDNRWVFRRPRVPRDREREQDPAPRDVVVGPRPIERRGRPAE